MSFVEVLIVGSCIGLSGPTHEACNNALMAGAKQSGIESDVNKMENKISKDAESEVRGYLGTNTDLLGSGLFIIKSIADKQATINLPNLGICNAIKANIGQTQSLVSLQWKF